MSSMNKAIIIGRAGKDPEIRHTPSGQTVASLSVATSEKYKDKSSGEMVEKTEWHRLVLWERDAEIAEKYIHKGDLVCIEGRIQTRQYTDKEGIEKYTTEIRVDRLNLMPNGERAAEAPAQRPAPPRPAPARRSEHPVATMDDDIPFADPYKGRVSYVV